MNNRITENLFNPLPVDRTIRIVFETGLGECDALITTESVIIRFIDGAGAAEVCTPEQIEELSGIALLEWHAIHTPEGT